MLKFKVKSTTHQTISTVSKYFSILFFLGSVVFFGYTMVSNYHQASTILSDPMVVDAEVTLDDVTYEKKRKRGTTETYHFSYHYAAAGKMYSKPFTASESNAEKYIDSGSVKIAYAKSNPELSGEVEILEKNHSISSLLWRGGLALLGLLFLAGVIFGLLTEVIFVNKEKPEEE